jgi:hypothetical protein
VLDQTSELAGLRRDLAPERRRGKVHVRHATSDPTFGRA